MTLCDGASKKKRLVHQLVIEAFVGPRPDGLEVCHGNGIKDDNRLENLRYDTPAGNRADIDYQKGEAHSQAKLTASEVLRIRELASIHTQAELARMFGVSPGAINGVVHHRNWAWLGPRPKASARSRKGGDLPPCPYRVFPPKPAPR
ncbi:HNH endonuclease [Ferrovibrio sp.]|uniref:HNH endonuclease n=1 Tax=Ferrovibrio sp. TaxID=1917215 RepID=UPI0031201ADC